MVKKKLTEIELFERGLYNLTQLGRVQKEPLINHIIVIVPELNVYRFEAVLYLVYQFVGILYLKKSIR